MGEIHVFDNFSYFQNNIFNKEPQLIEFTHNGRQLKYDKSTRVLYNDYYDVYGLDFLNKMINRISDSELKNQLEQHITYCKNYKLYCMDELESFFKENSLNMKYFDQLKDLVPFYYIERSFTKVLDNNVGSSNFDEVVSIFIAYFFNNCTDPKLQDYWIKYIKMICERFGDELGFEHVRNIHARANEILAANDSTTLIPFNSKKVSEDISVKKFISLLSKSLNENEDEKNDSRHIHIGKQTFYKKYMQLFPIYVDLKNRKEVDFQEYTNYKKVFKLYDYITDNYYENELQRFKDYLSMFYFDTLYDDLASYVPVSEFSISYFIKQNFESADAVSAFELYTAILIVYWIYDMENQAYSKTTNVSTLIKHAIRGSVNHNLLSKDNHDNTKQLVNNIIKRANEIAGKLNLPLIPMTQITETEFTKDGQFSLPWEYVKFEDNYLLLYHPFHINSKKYKPYRLNMKSAKASYNSIKLYFANTVPLLEVNSKDGDIESVINKEEINIDKYVTSILYRTSRNKVKIEIHRRTHECDFKTYTASELKQDPLVEKSYYLNELCKMQLSNYKVYNFMEFRCTSSASEREDAFCFVIKENNDKVVLAVENTLESRSTILFFVHKSMLDRALNVINVFFSSNTLNKRQSLQWKEVDFKDCSIIKYERIIHTSSYEWNSSIYSNLRYL